MAIYGHSRWYYIIFAIPTNFDRVNVSFFFVEDINIPKLNIEGG